MWAVPRPKTPPTPNYERRRRAKQLNEEQKETLVEKLYGQDRRTRDANKKNLLKRHNPEGESKVMPQDQMDQLVERNTKNEVEKRQRGVVNLEKKYYAAAEPKQMPKDQVNEVVSRMYNDGMRMQKDRQRKQEKKHRFQCRALGQKLPAEQIKGTTERLAKPRTQGRGYLPHTTMYTDQEVNKMLDL